MDINISGIKNQLYSGYQFSAEKVGKLKNLSVRILKQALEHVRQDPRLAGVTVAVSNILFLQIAWRMTILADKFFSSCVGDNETLSENALTAKNFVLIVFFYSLLVGMSVGLVKGLQLPLSPLLTAGISTTSCVSMALFLCLKNRKDEA